MERPDRVALLNARVTILLSAAALATAVDPGHGSAQHLTQDEALALAFPEADRLERRTAYLEEDQVARIAQAAGSSQGDTPAGIATYYVAIQGDEPLGVAYFDAHRVRTLDQVLMIVVGRDAQIRRVETVRFREPPEYRAPVKWLEIFRERGLGPDLSLKGEIPNITGATLTAGAVTRAVRRALALHEEVAPFGRSESTSP